MRLKRMKRDNTISIRISRLSIRISSTTNRVLILTSITLRRRFIGIILLVHKPFHTRKTTLPSTKIPNSCSQGENLDTQNTALVEIKGSTESFGGIGTGGRRARGKENRDKGTGIVPLSRHVFFVLLQMLSTALFWCTHSRSIYQFVEVYNLCNYNQPEQIVSNDSTGEKFDEN